MHLRKTPEPKLRIYSVDAKLRTFLRTKDDPKVQLRAHLRPYPRSPASRTRTCKRAPRYLGVRLRDTLRVCRRYPTRLPCLDIIVVVITHCSIFHCCYLYIA